MGAHLILTVDYEVFGNGQGCLQHCVVAPAERLLRVAQEFEAPVTVFAEAAEFMAMEGELGESAVRDVKQQLAASVRSGHDVQLHLHPQWQGAKMRADSVWALDLARWRIGDLPEDETNDLIASGKAWLDAAAFANSPGRGCMAFRAGSWCIQPSAGVIRALRRHGFTVESTVVPGVRRTNRAEWSDFRSAPDQPYWRVDGDVCAISDTGLLEVPIASGRLRRVEQLSAEIQARATSNSRFAPNCQGSYSTGTTGIQERAATAVRKMFDLGLSKLDFATMPARALTTITRDWIRRFGDFPETPIVAIAHTKNWTDRSSAHLADYLAWARAEGIRFSTYPSWLDSIGEH